MSATPDTTTSGGSANANHQASDKGKVASKNAWRHQKTKHLTTANETMKMNFEGKCDDLSGYIYDCADPKQAADMYTSTTKEISEYVGRTYKYGGEMRQVIMKLRKPTYDIPEDIPKDSSDGLKIIWKNRLTEYVKRESVLTENVKTAYSLIWGQCTDVMRQKIASHSDYETTEDVSDAIGLLKTIKSIMFNFQGQIYRPQALRDAKRRFYNMYQDRHMTVQAYLDKFQNSVEVIEHCGGDLGIDKGLIDNTFATANPVVNRETATPATVEAAKKYAREQYLACAFLLGADRKRYGKLLENLENDYTQKNDRWPKTITDAYSLLINWKQDPRNLLQVVGASSDGIAFANVGENEKKVTNSNTTPATATGNEDKKVWVPPPPIHTVKCYECNKYGHYSNECPTKTAVQLLMAGAESDAFDDNEYYAASSFQFVNISSEDGMTFHQEEQILPKTWILLDNQSTVDVFCNRHLLTNIRESNKVMNIRCNAGVTRTNMVGELDGYGTVWYNPKGIANILSLSQVEKKHRVTYDSAASKAFIVHKNDGSKRRFEQATSGLFYMDTELTSGTVLVNTVEENKSKYTERDYQRALVARRLQNTIGHKSTADLVHIVKENLLKNCPVTTADIMAAEDILGTNVQSLRGKQVRRGGQHVVIERQDVPRTIMERYKNVTLCIDIMFVNKIPFLVTISRGIKFGTVETLTDRKHPTIMSAIKHVVALYSKRGFRVSDAHTDNEFEPMRADLMDAKVNLNVASNNEHVPEIERHIRTVKDRVRCMYNSVPFKKMPSRMIVEMVTSATFWLNMFPPRDGVSKTISPRGIIHGLTVDYNKHCQLEFGSYAQVDEEHDNSMQTRTTGAISLRPTGNEQGGHYFMSLTTGRN